MKITEEMMDYIGVLSRINSSENEREVNKQEISKIIDYMDILNEIDTEGLEAMSHAFPVQNVFREDEVFKSVDKSDITKNAKNSKDGCFKVPKAVE